VGEKDSDLRFLMQLSLVGGQQKGFFEIVFVLSLAVSVHI